MSQDPFRPTGPGSSLTYAASATATAFALPLGDGNQVRLVNEATTLVRFAFGNTNTVPASFGSNSCSLLPSSAEIFTLDNQYQQNPGYVYLVSSAAANVNATRGSGS